MPPRESQPDLQPIDAARVFTPPFDAVEVTGEDRASYLHSLLTQDFQTPAHGDVIEFAYLDAKGEHLAIGTAIIDTDRIVLVLPQPICGVIAERLERFRFAMDVHVVDRRETWTVASLRGPDPVAVPLLPKERSAIRDGDGVLIRTDEGGVDLVGPSSWVEAHITEIGFPEGTEDQWEAWRILHGAPEWGKEVLPGHRSQELGLLGRWVRLDKGCYPGQESVAKIYNSGRPRRALARLYSETPLSIGAVIGEGNRPGTVFSSAPVASGGWVGLGFVPVAGDDLVPTVDVDGGPVRVIEPVGPFRGRLLSTDPRPRLSRKLK